MEFQKQKTPTVVRLELGDVLDEIYPDDQNADGTSTAEIAANAPRYRRKSSTFIDGIHDVTEHQGDMAPAQLYSTMSGRLFHSGRIAIVLVGLPARGKTYVSHCSISYRITNRFKVTSACLLLAICSGWASRLASSTWETTVGPLSARQVKFPKITFSQMLRPLRLSCVRRS